MWVGPGGGGFAVAVPASEGTEGETDEGKRGEVVEGGTNKSVRGADWQS